MSKKTLGLNLGTASIGWALVDEKENDRSEIIKTGVRIIPLIANEKSDFEKGNPISTNADRTFKRGMRRNLDRYKLRRKALLKILRKERIISDETVLIEDKKELIYTIWKLRSKAVTEKIELSEFARILMHINKKRGYKSNRKIKVKKYGTGIEGMEVTKKLKKNNLTPGQYVYQLLLQGKKDTPSFYHSDLQHEFDKIWNFQKAFYPKELTDELKNELKEKNKDQTWKICEKPFNLISTKRKGKQVDQRIENYKWRSDGLAKQIDLEQLTFILQDINLQIRNSSGLHGDISDRSKELYFKNQTIGQYFYNQIKNDKHIPLKNQVFYRQDHEDEFDKIWETQSKFHPQLTNELKAEIRNKIIFYQRRLKSQKKLLGFCEFESKEIEKKDKKGNIVINKATGLPKKQKIGAKVIPRSSPLFQEFKIWQDLNSLKFKNTQTREVQTIQDIDPDLEIRNELFNTSNVKEILYERGIVKQIFEDNSKVWELNFKNGIQGNKTNYAFYKAYINMVWLSGHEIKFPNKEDILEVFKTLGIDTDILNFDSSLQGQAFDVQPAYRLWHLLYSYEGDNSKTGDNKLYEHLKTKFGFERQYAQKLVNINFQGDYGNLSAKAIKNILPHMKAGHEYSEACELAGYNHSHSTTKEENEERKLNNLLELLPKNSLRNPVGEKILNQMVNLVNAIIKQYGKPDEIRIELARELKKNVKGRENMTTYINDATKRNEDIRKELEKIHPFNTGVRITKNDIVKYRLYQELESNGHKTLYTDTYIRKEELFSKNFDIEHIIPKAILSDDSFSNKTIATRDFNRWKRDKTGLDAVVEKYGTGSAEVERYKSRIEELFKDKKISKTKHDKLLMTVSDIPNGFREHDLKNTQYIAKKAKEMLLKIARNVTPVIGGVTDRLRQDWQLVDVMQELNWDRYEKPGLTKYEKNKDGKQIGVIKDWTKRNDYRHQAMGALTVAFTKQSHIQYLNYLNARKNEAHKEHKNIIDIENKETYVNDKNKRVIKPPMPINDFRAEVKKHLEGILVSFKAKNKAVTQNINKTNIKEKENQKTLTPRGQLHKETLYRTSQYYKTKTLNVDATLDEETIRLVGKKSHRTALLKRLQEFDNDGKKAFSEKNSPAKNPIYLDKNQSKKLPRRVRLVYKGMKFTIRKEVNPDLKIDKVIDEKIRAILQQRLQEFNNNPKKAFANLGKNPIWLNQEQGIQVKRVTITGRVNPEPLHYKKDHTGKLMLDEKGNPIQTNFVQTGKNHHIAIYKDEKGKLHEMTVSFFDAVKLKNQGLPIITKQHPEHPEWEFMFTIKQNEMFVFPNQETGFNPNEIDLMDKKNYKKISPNLFRVRKITKQQYNFIHHLETSTTRKKKVDNVFKDIYIEKIPELRTVSWRRIQKNLYRFKNVIKVRINHLGQIVKIGE